MSQSNIVLFLSSDETINRSLVQYVDDGLFDRNNIFHFVHIIDEHSLVSLPVGINLNDDVKINEHFQEQFEKLATLFKAEAKCELNLEFHLCLHSEAKLKAVQFLSEMNADSCVVATRGEQGVSGLFAESFAYFLVANAPCDVLVIRPQGKKEGINFSESGAS